MHSRAFLIAFALPYAAPALAQSVDVRGVDLPAELQEQLAAELPKDPAPETRFEARRQASRAAERLTGYLNSRGYFQAEVRAGVDAGPPPIPFVTVDPGGVFTLADVSIEDLDATLSPGQMAAARAGMDLALGEAITPRAVIDAEGRLVEALVKAGFAFARLEPRQVLGDRAAETVSITFRVRAGAPVILGEVRFDQGLRMRRRALEVLVPFEPGTPYSPELMDTFNSRLGATRLFSVFGARLEDMPAARAPGGATVHDVQVTLVERDRYTISAGASFASNEGVGTNAEWTRRNVTRRGDTLTVRATVAAQERSGEVTWSYPHAFGYGWDLGLTAGAGREETDAFDRENVSAAASFDIERTPRLGFTFAGANEFTRETDAVGERDLQIVSVSGAVRIDRTDVLLDPRRGWRADLRVEPGTLFGDDSANYVSTVGQASVYQPLAAEARLVAALRMRTGFVFGADQLELPTSRRFFAGGGGSARGYAFQAIGPEDETGQPLGGRGLTELSTELRWRRSNRLGFAAFLDGAAVTARDAPSLTDMRFGAGLGVRYYTAIGPLRLDLATPLDPRDGDDPVQVYISIGQAF
ncbi:MAG: BamA/TamA family outer membrane protein [Pseudomonadota bacterium]